MLHTIQDEKLLHMKQLRQAILPQNFRQKPSLLNHFGPWGSQNDVLAALFILALAVLFPFYTVINGFLGAFTTSFGKSFSRRIDSKQQHSLQSDCTLHQSELLHYAGLTDLALKPDPRS